MHPRIERIPASGQGTQQGFSCLPASTHLLSWLVASIEASALAVEPPPPAAAAAVVDGASSPPVVLGGLLLRRALDMRGAVLKVAVCTCGRGDADFVHPAGSGVPQEQHIPGESCAGESCGCVYERIHRQCDNRAMHSPAQVCWLLSCCVLCCAVSCWEGAKEPGNMVIDDLVLGGRMEGERRKDAAFCALINDLQVFNDTHKQGASWAPQRQRF